MISRPFKFQPSDDMRKFFLVHSDQPQVVKHFPHRIQGGNKGQGAEKVVLKGDAFAWMLWVTHMTSMTVDYPARLVYTTPRGHSFLRGTTQACIMKDIMCSCLTTVVAYRYKDVYSGISSTAHAPKQFDLVKKIPK